MSKAVDQESAAAANTSQTALSAPSPLQSAQSRRRMNAKPVMPKKTKIVVLSFRADSSLLYSHYSPL